MPGPFSCFSPSYHETLPRRAPHGPRATNPPSPDQSATSGSGAPRITSSPRQQAINQNQAFQAGPSNKVSKRRSQSTRARRISTDLIGHPDPTSFVHVERGSLDEHRPTEVPGSQRSLAALQKSMERASIGCQDLSSSLSPQLFGDQTNIHPLPVSAATRQDPSPPHKVHHRKPPPPVTASVIRQAGSAVVAASAQRSASPGPRAVPSESPLALPPPSPLSGPHPGVRPETVRGDRQPGPTSWSEKSVERTRGEVQHEGAQKSGGVAAHGDACVVPVERRDGSQTYMTDTAKVRLDDGLRALEEALRS